MKQKLLSFFALWIFLMGIAHGQTRQITGRVTSAGDGTPIAGITVVGKDRRTGAQTGADGNYSISITTNTQILIFRAIGYAEREITIGSNTIINVELTPDQSVVAEVIVTGYGQEIKKESLTGAVSVLSGAEIEGLPTQSFDRAMQGRLAGVQVTSSSGQPGGGLNVAIRGAVSVNGNAQPLYIIDGVQMNPGGVSTQTTQNLFSFVNQDDIESIQVLKDAATASIYGAQAANGVVLVTTKKGRAGRTVINLDVQQGWQDNPNPYDLATGSEYYELYRQAYFNLYNTVQGNGPAGVNVWNTRLWGNNPDSWLQPSEIINVNWYDEVFRRGNLGQYNLNVSGGSDKTTFYVGAGHNNTQGTVIGSEFKRNNLRMNLDHQASDRFSLDTRINLFNAVSSGPATGNGFFTNSPFTGALLIPTLNSIYNQDGTWNNNLINGYGYNIVQVLNEEDRETNTWGTLSSIALNYTVLPGLRLRAFGGLDFSDARNYNYRPGDIPAYAGTAGTGNDAFTRTVNFNTTLTANYNATIAQDHTISALAGFEYRDYSQRNVGAGAQTFPNPLLRLISQAATNTSYFSTFTGYKMASLIASGSYDYKGKYLFSGNMRYDGSSRFGSENRFGLFYGLSAGWRIIDEDFFDVSFMNELKLRASYGVTGDQGVIENFSALTLFNSPGAGGAYNGQATLRPNQMGVPTLTWEELSSVNLGLDFGFFNNRIFGSFDIYRNYRSNMLLDQELPTDAGYSSITVNAGRARLEGIDLELGVVPVHTGDFRWTSSFNIGFIDNKLLELNEQAAIEPYFGTPNINFGRYTVGQRLNQAFTIPWAGVNPADGRAMYYDQNDNITYNPVAVNDRRPFGSFNPDFFGGWNNTFSYKGISLDILFQYQYGNVGWTDTNYPLELSGAYGYNSLVNQLYESWSQPGDVVGIPRPFYNGAEPGSTPITTFSSRWLQDASYIRLKQLTLGYNLPKSIIGSIQSVRVFAQGMNLWTITRFTGEDPENTAMLAAGSTNSMNVYPHPVTFTFGAAFTF
ncbi:TonB-dependent receptor [Sphingobacterium sp. lm-10]|uniref:SusC/RagA family TonB-linked outer membrane protein n=1 Tax=Sphingobacterium sp. lm-10 TaxID=2944904 RepID=UPI00201FF6C8|nr:TonB-dependent receptor [Sphingobacterium sp. lm-10]MCL7989324.1 TonB-dependent receptor [Sphingobacterium sp. lm-10]